MGPSDDPTTMGSRWHDMITQLENMSTSTVQTNNELTTRVADLERELGLYKEALSHQIQESGRNKQKHQEEVTTLQKRLKDFEVDSITLCVIDGDGNIFANNLLASGIEGGREAGRLLTKGIDDYMRGSSALQSASRGRSTLWLSVYFNKKGLQKTLFVNEVCNFEQFEAFLTGFSQASPRFSLVDVGPGKEAADAKIKETLQTYARFPQVTHIFFGGGHDNGYLPTLTALRSEHLLDKLVILKGYHEIAYEIKALALPALAVENLFRPTKLPSFFPRKRATSMGAKIVNIDVEVDENSQIKKTKQLDLYVPQRRDTPPPCSEYYLSHRCPRGENCKFGHDRVLTNEELAMLASKAKSIPCIAIRKGIACAYGSDCIWGHKCPKGSACPSNATGTCWFKGSECHTDDTPSAPYFNILNQRRMH